jgi:hypothetical protein
MDLQVPKVAIDFCRSSFPDKACCVGGFVRAFHKFDRSLKDVEIVIGCLVVGGDAGQCH